MDVPANAQSIAEGGTVVVLALGRGRRARTSTNVDVWVEVRTSVDVGSEGVAGSWIRGSVRVCDSD